MAKSITTHEYDALLRLLREVRVANGVTQVELATRLKLTQSQISKCERGEVRLDLVQLRTHCQALGISLPEFVSKFEAKLRPRKR